MMITPIEIRQHSFNRTLRGFDTEEVRGFLTSLAAEWERLLEENRKIKSELERTKTNLDSYKEMEAILHKTLLQAEQSSKAMMENAKRDAELKTQEAENKAIEIIQKALEDRKKVETEIHDLAAKRNDVLQQLKMFLLTQTERLKNYENNELFQLDTRYDREAVLAPVKRNFFEQAFSGSGSDSSLAEDIANEL